MKGKFYESEYEESVVEILQQAGWDYTHGSDLHNRKINLRVKPHRLIPEQEFFFRVQILMHLPTPAQIMKMTSMKIMNMFQEPQPHRGCLPGYF